MTLLCSIQVPCKSLQLLNLPLCQRVIWGEGCSSCSSLSGTKLGIGWSLILVGVDDADEHGIPGVNAGHLQVSDRHCSHTSFSMFGDILISLKAASRSKLVQHLCISLLYWIPVLYFAVGSGTKSLLAVCAPSIWLIVPGS